jgi:tetratricopeptide (TPR) repeat protein
VCISATGEEAIAACTRILAVNPKDAIAYNGRGEAYTGKDDYFRKHDYSRAISDLDEAIQVISGT